MRLWYNRYKNPSETKLSFFASELNKGHVRQERPQVTVDKLKNWWKNERQREKRISMKEDSKEKEKKEIEKLRVEATKNKGHRKFLDQEKEKVKVAKIVPSPQKSLETRSRSQSGQGQLDLSVPQQDLISSQTQMILPLENRQKGASLTPNIIAVVDRPSSSPRGFVSLLQQNPGPGFAGSGPVARINPTSPGTGLATSGPGARIGHGNVQIWSGADGSEIRSCDFRPGQIGHGTLPVVSSSSETLNTFGGRSPEASDPNMRLRSRDREMAEYNLSPPSNYGNWNFEAQ